MRKPTDYNGLRRKGIDPGGIKCRCCANFPPAKQKRIQARLIRRALKIADKEVIAD